MGVLLLHKAGFCRFCVACGQLGIDRTFAVVYTHTMNPKLTKNEEQALQFITKYIEEHGYAPTRSEIGSAVSKNSANPRSLGDWFVKNLAAKKRLRHKKSWRGIFLSKSRVRAQ